MADKLVLLGDVRKKLYYIFRSYGTPECLKDDILKALKKIPAVDAEPVIRCINCKMHKNCITEDSFNLSGISSDKGFCCVGKSKED